MDGLVTNTALVAGVGGGGAAPRAIVLAGVASLVAGAISMALGEYTSVKTQNEQLELEVEKERRELERNPEGELRRAGEMLRVRGRRRPAGPRRRRPALPRPGDGAAAARRRRARARTRRTSPRRWIAAVSSFLTFGIGALIPLLPYLFGVTVLWPALVCGGLGLLAAGALSSRFTPRPWWYAGARQLLFGAAAAGITYLVGSAIGVTRRLTADAGGPAPTGTGPSWTSSSSGCARRSCAARCPTPGPGPAGRRCRGRRGPRRVPRGCRSGSPARRGR